MVLLIKYLCYRLDVILIDIHKASDKLSQLNIKLNMENFIIDILWFRVLQDKGNWCISRHTHSSYEFHFVAAGRCLVVLDNGEFIASEGEFYLARPGIYHEQRSIEENDYYVEYSMNCDFIKQSDEITEMSVINEILSLAVCKSFIDKNNILNLFYDALKEAYYEEVGFYNNIKSLANLIIVHAARATNENKINSVCLVPQKMAKNDYRFRLIDKYIEDNLGNNLTTKDLASFMFLSEKQVYRVIKEKVGKSTKEFINEKKLRKAKELLKNTELHIKKISEILGFTSEYYFNQFFKRLEGYPPGLYRSNVQKY
ncbi:MAG: AraC family transcriptional regulator [Clostridium sp.]|uniref:AraC family transcriptional regulator n=1 Tax=Clostridium sp. TaxID=1506 RepID=UPI003D6CBF3B